VYEFTLILIGSYLIFGVASSGSIKIFFIWLWCSKWVCV